MTMLTAPAAYAAPYCVSVQGIPDQCLYVDGRQCQTQAQLQGGACVVNNAEVVTPPGPGAFCLVDGGRAVQCIYNNRQTCDREAEAHHGACIQASVPPQAGVDPFAIRRPY